MCLFACFFVPLFLCSFVLSSWFLVLSSRFLVLDQEDAMYQRDWLDDVRWVAILLGVLTAVLLQIGATLLILRPLELALGWTAVVLVELSIATGAFISGWRAQHAPMVNGLIAALASAVLSLLATALRAPTDLNVFSILFLFGTFAVMGVIGGLAAGQIRARQAAR
jgi:putative membrane protein (TIGR04086 family)